MQTRPLTIEDAYEFTPDKHRDERGLFLEWYRYEAVEEAVGHPLELRQANLSVSARGVVRGIHYALVPPGQAKYITVPNGAVIDYVIDIRAGSPTFGLWDSVVLDDIDRRAVYLAEGLGHAFIALTQGATVSYLVSSVFDPQRELGVNILDEEIGLTFPNEIGDPILSPRDINAPSLADALASGSLPTWQECKEVYRSLATEKR